MVEQLVGSLSNDDGDGGDDSLQKNEIIFHLRMSQLSKSVQYAYRPEDSLRLNMHQQRSVLKEDTKH